MADPRLVLVGASGATVAENDDWGGTTALTSAFATVGAFNLTAGSKDAAMLATLAPGFYTVQISGVGGTAGETLIEIYAMPSADASVYLSYLGLRSSLSSGSVNVTGFVFGGTGASVAQSLLVRAVGPSLGVAGALSDPTLSLLSGATVIAQNDNWISGGSVNPTAAEFGLPLLTEGGRDSAIVTLVNPGAYTAQVTGVGGVGGAVLLDIFDSSTPVVPRSPFVLTAPTAVSAIAGQTATLAVTAGGTGTLGYQWRKDGSVLAGRTQATLSITAFAADAGAYDVTVTNTAGSVTTPAVALSITVPSPPQITAFSGSVAGFVGGSAALSVTATGSGPLGYQWRKGGVAVAGAMSATLAWSNLQLADAGSYDVVVSNAGGSVASAAAVLSVTVPVPPMILTHPVGGTLNAGNVASFGVIADGSAPLSYQWRRNGVPISGANQNPYILGNVTTASAGSYDVVVSNVAGSVTSLPAVLVVNPAVTITLHPANVAGFVGMPVTLSVTAIGSGPPAYQWRKDGVALLGATAGSLGIAALQPASAGVYDVVVSNFWGSATSNAATITVGDAAPTILVQPLGAALAVGGSTVLSVTASGSHPLTYAWRRSGVTISGATNSTLPISNAQSFHAGDYEVLVANALGQAVSATARLTVVPRVASYTARLLIGPEAAFGVFTVEGSLSKTVLLRAVGPGLAPFGLAGLMVDPQLELFDSAGRLLVANNDWGAAENAATIATTTAAVGAFALGTGSRDSAILRTLAPGTYTVRASPVSGAGGVAYLELHDASAAGGVMSTIPFVSIRGRVAPGAGVVIGGLGSNGRGPRSYLLRTLGQALGVAGAVSDPAFLVIRENTLVGANDRWDANSAEAAETATASNRLGLVPLSPGGNDAALVLTGNLHAGPHTVQVSSPEGTNGLVLLELHDLDLARPIAFAPVITSPPIGVTAVAGTPVSLRVLANGTPPLSFQWSKDGAPVSGVTGSSLNLASATAANAGVYAVTVTNASGAATSLPALLTVQNIPAGSSATQAVAGSGYAANGTVLITNTLTFTGSPGSLGWTVTLPPGWTFVGDGGAAGEVKPVVGTAGQLDWAWTNVPASPVIFTYTVSVPAGETGNKLLLATGIVRENGAVLTLAASPSPLSVGPMLSYHSADTTLDNRINLFELTRVIELYNTRNGTTRTGCYLVQAGAEDGFAPDPTRTGAAVAPLAAYHSADSNRDGRLSLLELTRVIELYNHRAGTTRTGQYHVQPGTEDGFGPGP